MQIILHNDWNLHKNCTFYMFYILHVICDFCVQIREGDYIGTWPFPLHAIKAEFPLEDPMFAHASSLHQWTFYSQLPYLALEAWFTSSVMGRYWFTNEENLDNCHLSFREHSIVLIWYWMIVISENQCLFKVSIRFYAVASLEIYFLISRF